VSPWTRSRPLGRTWSTNYASIHLVAHGSQCCKAYFGPSRSPISPTPTCSSPPQSPISALRLRCSEEVPHDILSTAASKISKLPAPTIQFLDISREIPWAHFTDPLSAFVLRCGPPLTDFPTIPLSDAAINHLIQLPHLRTWALRGPPPEYSTSHLPLVFPPLTELTLLRGATYGWFPLLKHLECCVSTTRSATPLDIAKESLRSLSAEHFPDAIIDPSFSFTVQMFRNLALLNVGPYCCFPNGKDQCTFKLHDDDVTQLVTVLPRLKHIAFGRPCPENSCSTTVACLLSISVHCVELRSLGIHFNTTNIIDDFRNISEGPRFQELRSHVWMPFRSHSPSTSPKTVADGMIKIFPSLGVSSRDSRSHELEEM